MHPARSDNPNTPVAGAAPRRGALLVRLAVLLAGAGVVVALDQLTKALIRGWLAIGDGWPGGWELIRLSHYENSGAAFGILQGGGGFLTITSIIAIGAVLAFLWWAPPQARLYSIALSLILGGAIGNLIDRLARGTVTDFIDPTHYPAFNIADSSIVIGVCVLGVLSLLEEREARRAPDASTAAADQQASP
jgi:signal peptidase II